MFSYGFYNSLNGDRKYNAEQMSSIFDGIIVDGIFENVGEIFATVPGSGLEVIVKTGRAWFKHTWSLNDSWLPLTLPEADLYRNRIDAVVLEVNHDINVRKNEIKIVSGEPSVAATKPIMVHNENVDQYALAYVTVLPLATSILEDNIEIMVGRGDVPFVTCPLKTIPINDLFNQWNGEFTTWFNNLKAQLTDNVVTNLQDQIDETNERLNNIDAEIQEQIPELFSGAGAGSLFMVSKYYKEPIESAVLCNGGSLNKEAYPELFDVLGYTYGSALAYDSIKTLYNINGTFAYPEVYNRDLDAFIGTNVGTTGLSAGNYYFVIYRRSQAPSRVYSPSMVGLSTNAERYALVSFGSYIFLVSYTGSAVAGSSPLTIQYVGYNIATGQWLSQSQFPTGLSDCMRGAWDTVTNLRTNRPLAFCETANYFWGVSYSSTSTVSKVVRKIKKSDLTSTAITCPSYVYSCCVDFDHGDNDVVYVLAYPPNASNSYSITLYKIEGTTASVVAQTAKNSISSQYLTSGLIYNGILHTPAGKITIPDNPSDVQTIQSSGLVSGVLVNALKNDEGLWVCSSGGSTLRCLQNDGTVVTSQLGLSIKQSTQFNEGMICTSSGPVMNPRQAVFKLPTISLSDEALVYMRTKSLYKEA